MLPLENGKRECLERLYDEYYDKVYVYIARRISNSHDAEDLTSHVFLKALANPYDPELARFSTYIYTITANVLKNFYRTAANSAGRVISLYGDGGERELDLPDVTDLLGDLITREEYTELKIALTKLPDRQYEAVYRRYYLEQTFKEIGQALNVSEDAAKKLHKRAVISLKKIYWKRASLFTSASV